MVVCKAAIAVVLCCIGTAGAACPLRNSTRIVYSIARTSGPNPQGVGPASQVWIADLLWWWSRHDPSVTYQSLTASELQACELAAFPNLRVFLNPGGNAYYQATALGPTGRKHIRDFVLREDPPAAYAGFCAGAYIAAHDYIWETVYEGLDYLNFRTSPPFSLFPHTVEGSLVDIGDDQFGDQRDGTKYRLVNVSNGHKPVNVLQSTFTH